MRAKATVRFVALGLAPIGYVGRESSRPGTPSSGCGSRRRGRTGATAARAGRCWRSLPSRPVTSPPVGPEGARRGAGGQDAGTNNGSSDDVEAPGERQVPLRAMRAKATVRLTALGLAPIVTWAESPALARRGRVVRVDDREGLA